MLLLRASNRARIEGRVRVKRLLLGFAALVLGVVAFAETAAARNPGGRNFNGAVFSAGVSGDATTAPGPAIVMLATQRIPPTTL